MPQGFKDQKHVETGRLGGTGTHKEVGTPANRTVKIQDIAQEPEHEKRKGKFCSIVFVGPKLRP